MLYVIHGTDVSKARSALHKMVDALVAKKPDAAVVPVEGITEFGAEELEGYIAGQGLFEKNFIVVFDHILKSEEATEQIQALLPAIAESSNVFLILEEKISAPVLNNLQKQAAKVVSFEKPEEKQTFNIFSLADALGKRDRKALWVTYQKAKLAGLPDEQMHGTLLWQVRSMLLARASRDAKEAGLAPFVFSKSSRYEKNYPGLELPKLSADLVAVLHDARRGIAEFDIGFEKLLLSI